jgi:YbbR domain-containing protein
MDLFRWFARYFPTFLVSLVLAGVVWVSAVVSVDPNVEALLTRQVPIEIVGDDPDLRIMNDYTRFVSLTLLAPQSIWNQINADPQTVKAWIDLAGLADGEFTVPVNLDIKFELVRVLNQDPLEVTILREKIISRTVPISLTVNGAPPLGYRAAAALLDPAEVNVTGPESLVNRVDSLRTQVDISGATDDVFRMLNLSAVDSDDRVVNGVTVTPSVVSVTVPIELLGGYRNVIVRPITTGIVASGYRLTNYNVSPTSVIVFSSDPRLVEALPGYVQTMPIDLSGADDDFEALVELDLPVGVTAATDSKVFVQISIAAIETSLSISLPIEITGLSPSLVASISPTTVDVILSGPVPVLSDLQPNDIRVKVDLMNYMEGVYQLIPIIDFLPQDVRKVSILPATVEVTIGPIPTATPTFFFPQSNMPAGIPTPTSTPTP